ncbi:hypothetical protein ACO0QE_000718 [Hanseniaspora vineae]
MSSQQQSNTSSGNSNSLVHMVAEYYSLVIESERIYQKHVRNMITRTKDKEAQSKTAKLMEEVKCEKQVDDLYTQIMDLQKKNEHLQRSNKTDREKFESKIDRQNKRIQELYKLVSGKSSQSSQVISQDKETSEKAIHLLTPRKPLGSRNSHDRRQSLEAWDKSRDALKAPTTITSDKRNFREVLSQNTIFDKSLDDIVIFNAKRKPTVQFGNGNLNGNSDKIDECSKENITSNSEKSTFSNETAKYINNIT